LPGEPIVQNGVIAAGIDRHDQSPQTSPVTFGRTQGEGARMRQFRTTRRFIKILVALFFVAQFAGVVPSPLGSTPASAHPASSHVHHQHAHHDRGGATSDREGDKAGHHADYCCALHAFFVGLVPPVIAIETAGVVGEPLAARLADIGPAADQSRLDRPPRPIATI
jgi:hypothetical protein